MQQDQGLHPRKRKELVQSKAAVTPATGRRYLLRHAGMPRDFVGPALQLQHGVFVQKLREQEHAALGESTGWALLFPPETPGQGGPGMTVTFPASLSRTPGTLFRIRLLFSTASTRTFHHHPPLSQLLPPESIDHRCPSSR